MRNFKLLACFGENALLAGALFMLVPPVPSSHSVGYNFFPVSFVLMSLLLASSRYIAIRTGTETWVGAVLKFLIFTTLGFVLYSRVTV